MRAPIADRTLWDSLGNKCRVEMYCLAESVWEDRFEVYLHHFNDSTPVRYVNTLAICNNTADHFLTARKADGFVEQLPSYNPDAWRA